MNKLYFGDNLDVLHQNIKDVSVDLIYLDPPFNSNATYNVLFRQKTGAQADAQAEAFRDTWEWGEAAERSYDDVIRASGTAALVVSSLRRWLGENSMMAYITMMAVRLIEMHRALKPSGSLYLHCDPTASHYIKVLLDAIFGVERFVNEICWQRTTPNGLAFSRFASSHDTIFLYRKGEAYTWKPQHTPRSTKYVEKYYNMMDEPTGRRFQPTSLLNPNPDRPNLKYEFHGHLKVWRWTRERMGKAEKEGRIYFPPNGGVPREKRFLDEQEGVPVTSVWTDIAPVNSQAQERTGYATQKPLALLERMIKASSNDGDIVLDPFCGCGTTIEAAERLKRKWIGVDVTHFAISLIEERLKRAHPSCHYSVQGRPTDLAGAHDLARRDKHQFQWWATWYLGAQSYREEKRGPDRGIDGNIYFQNGPYGTGRIIISVKGGATVGVGAIRELSSVVQRENADMGILVTLADPTSAMNSEAVSCGFVPKSAHGRLPKLQIVTVAEMLDGRFPQMPPLPQPVYQPVTRGRKRRRDTRQLELLLPFEGLAGAQAKEDFVDPRFMRFGA
jgi:adenine specific DNA methylase Mod